MLYWRFDLLHDLVDQDAASIGGSTTTALPGNPVGTAFSPSVHPRRVNCYPVAGQVERTPDCDCL